MVKPLKVLKTILSKTESIKFLKVVLESKITTTQRMKKCHLLNLFSALTLNLRKFLTPAVLQKMKIQPLLWENVLTEELLGNNSILCVF